MTREKDLEGFRTKIREIDDKILSLASERMKYVRKVGEYKQENNLPIKDYKVEKQILETARNKAKSLGIYGEMAESLLKELIKYSVIEQDELKKPFFPSTDPEHKTFGIIGGLGHMGSWLSGFFESLGHKVIVQDIKPKPENFSFAFEEKIEAVVQDADFVVLATPLGSSKEALDKIIELKPTGVVVEMCSLKAPIENTLKEAIAKGIKIASIHPMFGPDLEILAGRNIMLCTGICDSALSEVEAIFSQTSANLIKVDFNKHDTLMSYVLGASHLINLIFAQLMRTSEIDVDSFSEVAGTTFKNQLSVTLPVVRENQDLYFDIQVLNEHTESLIEHLLSATEAFKEIIASKDREAFQRLMAKAAEYFSKL